MKTISRICTAIIVSALTCARAVTPAPEGGYDHWNTAVGEDALFSLTTGMGNTALGWRALYSITESSFNTAVGMQALSSNTTGTTLTATGFLALFSNTEG